MTDRSITKRLRSICKSIDRANCRCPICEACDHIGELENALILAKEDRKRAAAYSRRTRAERNDTASRRRKLEMNAQ